MLKIFSKIPVFFREVKAELVKATWPNRRELTGATWVVMAITGVLTVYVGIIDFVLSKVVEVVLK